MTALARGALESGGALLNAVDRRRRQRRARLLGPNHAMLVGKVLGALLVFFPTARLEADADGNCTNRILIDWRSGTWAVHVDPEDVPAELL